MNNYDDLIKILNDERKTCFLPNDFDDKKYRASYCGEIVLSDRTKLELIIAFPFSFPLNLPDFYINDRSYLRVHVDNSGKICLFDESSLLIKTDLEERLLIDAFDQAITILNILPGSQEYNNEIQKEFDSYWLSVSKNLIYSAVDTKKISNYSYKSAFISTPVTLIAETETESDYFAYNYFKIQKDVKRTHCKCVVIKLRNNSTIPQITENPTWNLVRRYINSNISGSTKREFKKFTGQKVKNFSKFILLVRPSINGNQIFGYNISANNTTYKKLENDYTAKITPVYVSRIDRDFLVNRGCGESMFEDKCVLLLGCGSVGGYIANNLCQIGISELDLLDNDSLYPENVYRHVLGFDSAIPNHKNKADALKENLERKFPYVTIDSLNYNNRSAEAFLLEPRRILDYDLIISALGEPTINLEINKILFNQDKRIPFICCFNEPYGIGGHAIVVNICQDSCLQCLYTDAISNDIVPFRASLTAPNQQFKKNVSGCGSAFTPYSSLDSQQTAILVSRMVVDVFSKKIEKNTLISWLGSSDGLVSNGFKPSEYYLSHNNQSQIVFDDFHNEHCKCALKNNLL